MPLFIRYMLKRIIIFPVGPSIILYIFRNSLIYKRIDALNNCPLWCGVRRRTIESKKKGAYNRTKFPNNWPPSVGQLRVKNMRMCAPFMPSSPSEAKRNQFKPSSWLTDYLVRLLFVVHTDGNFKIYFYPFLYFVCRTLWARWNAKFIMRI